MSILQAMKFAMDVHKSQIRRYTKEPYFLHLAEVAAIASSVYNKNIGVSRRDFVSTCWLHDCIEDQNVNRETLSIMFGECVDYGVVMLSDLDKGNRETRKKFQVARLSKAEAWVQTIKCADIISNTSSIKIHDPKFFKVYSKECLDLLDNMLLADKNLIDIARKGIES